MAKKKAAPKTAPKTEAPKVDAAVAAEVLKAEQEERRQRCGARIQQILTEEGCTLVPTYTITPDKMVPNIEVVPVR
jgi:hypothetical protein